VLLPQEGATNHDGFLDDLAGRASFLGGVQVDSMVALNRGNFALIPVFNVTNTENGQQYTYEYVSWRQGPHSGAKGIVFVRPPLPGAQPTHFITLVGDKFAPGTLVDDTVGGFMDLGVGGVQKVMDRIGKEVREETGVEDLVIDEVVELGQIHPDVGMTNNYPSIFTAFISSAEAARIPVNPINPDTRELRSGALVTPMRNLRQFVLFNTDAIFHAAMLRAIANDTIAYEWFARGA
jgi:hypothetical protein